MPTLPELTVFFPCHDEAENLPGLVARTLDVLGPLVGKLEVVIVDDGSRDATPAVAAALAAGDPRVRTVRHEDRRGYGAALRTGFAAARHDWVFFTDGDAQFDPAELPRLVALRDATGADVVVGWRADRRDPAHRRLAGRCWSGLVRALFRLPVRDVDCAFKLLPAAALRRIRLTTRGAVTSTELLVKLRREGYRIAELPVGHRPRLHGRATGGSLRVGLFALWELARLWGSLHLPHGAPDVRGAAAGHGGATIPARVAAE